MHPSESNFAVSDDDTNFDIVEPSASPILESLRAFGYSAESAIADIVDNSISAGATAIRVDFVWAGPDSYVAIADDGSGMSESKLVDAMRLGSQSPVEERAVGDLGRFGLGMKTASFSQARVLTVASRTGSSEPVAVRRWDLDLVRETGEWRLGRQVLDQASGPINAIADHGTVVVWTKPDRLLETAGGSSGENHRRLFLQTAERVAEHLSMTFHRFILNPRRLKLEVNGRLLRGWDPFLQGQGSWSPGPEQLPYGNHSVVVHPFVLPHKSKMTEADHERGAGRQGWNSSQGFYVYREDRLLVAGSWLGVGGAKEEHTKLARIAVNIPSALDHAWQVDVRKSSIKVPGAILADLRRVARATRAKAQEVYRFRGKVLASKNSDPMVIAWNAHLARNGATAYRINRSHPLIADALAQGLASSREVERLLRFCEETVPVTQIGIAMSSALDVPVEPFEARSAEVRDQLSYLVSRLVAKGSTRAEAVARLAIVEPFSYHLDIVKSFEEESGGHV